MPIPHITPNCSEETETRLIWQDTEIFRLVAPIKHLTYHYINRCFYKCGGKECPVCNEKYISNEYLKKKYRSYYFPIYSITHKQFAIIAFGQHVANQIYSMSQDFYNTNDKPHYLWHPHNNGFLRHITDNPEDIVARLAYADWLDEHDQHDKAKILRHTNVIVRSLMDATTGNNIQVTRNRTLFQSINPPGYRVTILQQNGLCTDIETILEMPDFQKELEKYDQPVDENIIIQALLQTINI